MRKIVLIASVCMVNIAFGQSIPEGVTAMENDKLIKATQIFQSILKSAPKNAEVYYQLGKVYEMREYNDSAVMAFKKSFQIAPGTLYGQLAQTRELLSAINVSDAVKKELIIKAKKAADAGLGKDIPGLREAAYAFIQSKVTDANVALEYANKALLLDKKNALTLTTLGDIYTFINDGGKAASNYDYAIIYDATSVVPYHRLGVLYTQARSFTAAQENFNLAITKNPNYAPAHRDLGNLYYKAKKYEKAKESYKKYLELSETNIQTLTRYAYVLFLKKDYDEALTTIGQVQQLDSSNIYLKRMLAYSYCEQNKPKEGLENIEKFLAKVDQNRIITEDYEYYGKLLFKNGQDSLGVINIKKALSLDTTKTNLYYDLGDMFYKGKKFALAADAYQTKVIKSTNPTAADYFGLGRSHYFNKNYVLADSAFVKLLKIKDNYALGYLYRGKCNSFINDKDPDLTKPYYEKFLELAGTDPKTNKRDMIEAYKFMAFYNIQKEKSAVAKDFYNKVIVLDPEDKQAKEMLTKLK